MNSFIYLSQHKQIDVLTGWVHVRIEFAPDSKDLGDDVVPEGREVPGHSVEGTQDQEVHDVHVDVHGLLGGHGDGCDVLDGKRNVLPVGPVVLRSRNVVVFVIFSLNKNLYVSTALIN